MAKLKCPHCGAMNQDVEASDLCWQCDFALDAPKVEDVDLTKPELHTPANTPETLTQVQKPAAQPTPLPALTPTEKPASRTVPIFIIAAVVMVLLLILFLVLKNR